MLTKRIIPCLDVMNGRTVKGINFEGLRDAGDIVELASRYSAEGADKVSVNSAALDDPGLIDRLSRNFGQQCVVLAVDAKQAGDTWQVFSRGGKLPTRRELIEWIVEAQQRGCGEILFTSMNNDGTKSGFACRALSEIARRVSIPVIASGGAGSASDFYEAFTSGMADAALAAGIFHYGETTIGEVKNYLRQKGINVRI